MAEVEVDLTPASVEIVRYRVCDDFGKTVNPMIVRGQVHGGVAQGLGEALLERTSYTTLARASYFPAASWTTHCRVPTICRTSTVDLLEVPSVSNPLGVKGRRRGGLGWQSAGVDQCHHRRAVGRWRDGHQHARDTGSSVAGTRNGAHRLRGDDTQSIDVRHGLQSPSWPGLVPASVAAPARVRMTGTRAVMTGSRKALAHLALFAELILRSTV